MKNIKCEISLLKFTNEDLTGLSIRVEEFENKILNTLRKQYKGTFGGSMDDRLLRKRQYLSVRVFCLDCELVSFKDIEDMEDEVNSSF